MARVVISPVDAESETISYRAVLGQNQAMGHTAGKALDALIAQLPKDEAETTVIVLNRMGPDRFFNADQCRRLKELTTRKREGTGLSDEERDELEKLIDAEMRASVRRAEMIHESTK